MKARVDVSADGIPGFGAEFAIQHVPEIVSRAIPFQDEFLPDLEQRAGSRLRVRQVLLLQIGETLFPEDGDFDFVLAFHVAKPVSGITPAGSDKRLAQVDAPAHPEPAHAPGLIAEHVALRTPGFAIGNHQPIGLDGFERVGRQVRFRGRILGGEASGVDFLSNELSGEAANFHEANLGEHVAPFDFPHWLKRQGLEGLRGQLDAEEIAQGLLADGAGELPGRIGVGKNRDGKGLPRAKLEPRALPMGGAAVMDESLARQALDVPRQANSLPVAPDGRLRRLHRADRFRGKHLHTVLGFAQVEQHPRIGEQGGRVRHDGAHWCAAAGQAPGHDDLRGIAGHPVPDREAFGHERLGVEVAILQAERLEQRIGGDLLKGLARRQLDQVPEQHEGGVVVGIGGANRRDLRQLCHACGVFAERVLAGAGINEKVAEPSAGVREQMPYRRLSACLLIKHTPLRRELAHAGAELQLARLNQAHDDGAGESFGDGADLKEGGGLHRQRVVEVGHAKSGGIGLAANRNADSRSGDVPRAQLLLGKGAQTLPWVLGVGCHLMNLLGESIRVYYRAKRREGEKARRRTAIPNMRPLM